MRILDADEQARLEHPPVFNSAERKRFLDFSKSIMDAVHDLRSTANRIGFLLAYGYFRATRRFFSLERYHERDEASGQHWRLASQIHPKRHPGKLGVAEKVKESTIEGRNEIPYGRVGTYVRLGPALQNAVRPRYPVPPLPSPNLPEMRLGPSVVATRSYGVASSGGVGRLLDPETFPGLDGGGGCRVPEYSGLKRRVCPTFPADSFFR